MQLSREEILSSYSDMHKDAYGYRPRDWSRVDALDDAALNIMYEGLCFDIKCSIEAEAAEEKRARATLKSHLDNLMEDFGIDRATAVRWDMQAMGCTDDFDHYCWSWGFLTRPSDRKDTI